MAEHKKLQTDLTPIALEKLDLTGTLLQDDGITEILPLIAEHFSSLHTFLFNACRLTEQSGPALADFIENRFPANRPLYLELKLQNIRKHRFSGKGTGQDDPFTVFKNTLKTAKANKGPTCLISFRF